ncbi:carboxymuconolactone decarboxylase family protein [Sulfitobacter geojensis]|nr:carboxymuconolactone decarboxylase family protein [Sulfitobacter geojensis]
MSLSAIFANTGLSETERRIILMTNNRLNGCKYCMAAHTTLSQMAGVNGDVIDALRRNTPIADAKLEALRQFAITNNESRDWPSQKQLNALMTAGHMRQSVLEVILGTALKVLSDHTNHAAHTALDDAFEANHQDVVQPVAAEKRVGRQRAYNPNCLPTNPATYAPTADRSGRCC